MRLARAIVWKYLGGQLASVAWCYHWRWAGHLARYADNFWPKSVTYWFGLHHTEYLRKLSRGKFRLPDRRRVWRWEQCVSDFCKVSPLVSDCVGILFPDSLWLTVAQDRILWKACEEPFIQSRMLRPHNDALALSDGDVEVDLHTFLQALEDVQLAL